MGHSCSLFALNCSKIWKKTWSVRYRIASKRFTQKIGIFPNVSLVEARNTARQILAAVDRGENPSEEKRKRNIVISAHKQHTILSLLEDYDRLQLSRLKTRAQANQFLKKFREGFGNVHISNFTKDDFIRLIDQYVERGKNTSANRVHSHVKTFFNWTISRGIIERNPCDRVQKPCEEKSRERFLSDQEICIFWRATELELEPYGYTARLLLLTGQRLSECAKLTKSEMRGTNHWHLDSTRTKNGNHHDVFLSITSQEIVHRTHRVSGSYFFSLNGHRPVSSFIKPLKRLRKRMHNISENEIPHFTFHDLRRTCETGMAMLGTPQSIIDRITNHVSGRGMARVYNMYEYRKEKTEALQKWDKHIRGLIS